jgi:PHD/YefM family antitoxin component YafN of YafNO toxin-antitoxin module
LLESNAPVAITRHGDTVGYYIPARRKRSESEREAMRQAATRMEKMLAATGVAEDEVLADFKKWRKSGRK